MTSFSTVFGVLPIALALGAGGESRRPLGLAVVGGVLFSTFLTLVLVPVLYTLLARFTNATKVEEDLEDESTENAKVSPITAAAAMVNAGA